MGVEFLDMEDKRNPLNGKQIDNPDELVKILDQLRRRDPFGLELTSDKGAILTVCLAETLGAVQYTTDGKGASFMLAVAPGTPSIKLTGDRSPHSIAFEADEERGLESPEFSVGGTATSIPTRYCLPYELVKEIAVHFLETGQREPCVLWEEI